MRTLDRIRTKMNKLKPAVLALSIAFFVPGAVSAQDTNFEPERQQIPVPDCLHAKDVWDIKPCTEDEHNAWLADIRHWRSEHLIRIGYDGSRYDLPALKWTQSSFFSRR